MLDKTIAVGGVSTTLILYTVCQHLYFT